jgi:Fe-S cluster biogenesis protein NfuA
VTGNTTDTITDLTGTFQRVAKVINAIRPAVQADGGDVELVDLTPAGTVKIRLHGACVGCPSSMITLKEGIERNLQEHVPEVSGVESLEH